jgi:hypothetical protein
MASETVRGLQQLEKNSNPKLTQSAETSTDFGGDK